jgi:hypothetical protein
MSIQLAPMARKLLTEGGKLFGPRAERVTTGEMNQIFTELETVLKDFFTKFKLSKALPSKQDHGDIDIVVSGAKQEIAPLLKNELGDAIVDYSKNGNIYSILYKSRGVGKMVHVDFINANGDAYDAQYDYLSYNDFSGVLGVFSRKIHFSYGTEGFSKIYTDKKGNIHYIPITKNLRDGLKIMGYAHVLPKFDHIQNPDDVAEFIASTDLFDSKYLSGDDMNRSDRKRIRVGRTLANEIKDKLVDLNKTRTQPDEDHYLKTLFPEKYKELMAKANDIETKTAPKSIYNGNWVMSNFPSLKPGPIIGKITLYLFNKFGAHLETAPESEVKAAAEEYIKMAQG